MADEIDGVELALKVTELVKDYPRPSRGWRSFFLPSWKQGAIRALDGVSLDVRRGSVFGLLGTNGAGKTTLIKICYNLLVPTSGSVQVLGEDPLHHGRRIRSRMGMVNSEERSFYWRLSGRRNLEFFGGFYNNLNVSQQVEKYLKMMGLWERREDKVGTFSKGMKQRLALARALLHEPKVLFLDEPTAGLDPEAAHEVRDMVKRLSLEGRTIFLSTHNLTEAELLCHRIAIIRTQLLALDTAESLRQRLFRRQVVIQLESLPDSVTEIVAKLPFVQQVKREENRLLIELNDPESNRPELVKRIVEAGGRVMTVSEERHSLEEVYLTLLQEDRNRDQ